MIRSTLLALAFAVGLSASETAPIQMNHIADEAGKVAAEARVMKDLLRSRTPDYAKVSEQLVAVEKHSDSVHDMILKYEAANPDRSSNKDFVRMKTVSEIKKVFVDNKKDLLTGDRKDRTLLIAKADGIQKRAEQVQKTALRLGN